MKGNSRMKIISTLVMASIIIGCSANKLNLGAEGVLLTSEKPENCRYIGGVTGSQGNWFTDDITTTENKILGSKNEIKNEALKINANTVYIISEDVYSSVLSIGTTSATQTGEAYYCSK